MINVVRRPQGKIRLTTDEHWRQTKLGWQQAWLQDRTPDEWRRRWSSVEDYLEAVIPVATLEKGTTEGAVQAAVSGFSSAQRVMLDREVLLAFKDDGVKKQIMAALSKDLIAASASVRGIPGASKLSFGGRCDVLALDAQGRLLAVEVKPKNTATIVWAGLQATMYARLLRRWLVLEQRRARRRGAGAGPRLKTAASGHPRPRSGYRSIPTCDGRR